MMPLAEQQKLPWCNCDFRATGEWSWCQNYDWCEGRKVAAQRIEARSDETPAEAVQPEGREPGPKDAPKDGPTVEVRP